MSGFKRGRLYIDSKVQGILLRRALTYLAACTLFLLLPIFIGRALADPQHLFFENLWPFVRTYGIFFTCLILMTPLVVWDILKLSNRFAGPFFRLRREMRRLADGEPVAPLDFRDGDFWDDVAPAFNAIVHRIETLERCLDKREEYEATEEVLSS